MVADGIGGAYGTALHSVSGCKSTLSRNYRGLYGNDLFGYWNGALSGLCCLVHPRSPKLSPAGGPHLVIAPQQPLQPPAAAVARETPNEQDPRGTNRLSGAIV